jgi:hypothetical protein
MPVVPGAHGSTVVPIGRHCLIGSASDVCERKEIADLARDGERKLPKVKRDVTTVNITNDQRIL